MEIQNQIKEFFLSFKSASIDEKNVILNYKDNINELYEKVINDEYYNSIEENILLIYGYSFRIPDLNQRFFYTFSEAINAINLENLMKNEESLKLNCFVYIVVVKLILDEINGLNIDQKFKEKAITEYKKLEENRAKENRYHVQQY